VSNLNLEADYEDGNSDENRADNNELSDEEE